MFIPIAPPQHFSLLRPEERNDICDDFLMTFFSTKVNLSHKLCNLSEIDLNFHNPNFQTSKILHISWHFCWSPRFFHYPSNLLHPLAPPPLDWADQHLLSILFRWRKLGPWIESANVETSVSTIKSPLDVVIH